MRHLFDPKLEQTTSRARLLTIASGAVAVGGAVVAGLPGVASPAPSPEQDVEILNYALLLEYFQSAFYAEAIESDLSGDLLEFARIAAGHERVHVETIAGALGERALRQPTFAFGDATSDDDLFVATAVKLEDLAVAAYNGQAANLTKATLIVAAKIVSVDARHAAWIRAIAGKTPARQPTDQPKTRRQVLTAIDETGFVRSGS